LPFLPSRWAKSFSALPILSLAFPCCQYTIFFSRCHYYFNAYGTYARETL
jgi:hypothetical protein